MRPRFDAMSIFLHWFVAIAIVLLAAVEILRGELPKGSFLREALKAVHEPVGTVVLAVVFVRLAWRSLHRPPAMPAAMRPWEIAAAKAVHVLLYALMLAIPLTGLAYTLARGRPVDFGLFRIAYPLDAAVGRQAARSLRTVHELLGQAVLAVAFVHAAAALWHHYVRKDDVLARMLPGRQPRRL